MNVWKALPVIGCEECDKLVAKYGYAATACTPCIDYGEPVLMEQTEADKWMAYMDRVIINTKEDLARLKEKNNGYK